MATAELRVLQRLNEYEFGVELYVLRTGPNRNKWDFQNMQEHYLSILGRPILCAFPYGRIGDGHEMEKKTTPSGKEYYSFISKPGLERIVGAISEDPADVRLEEIDGETWLIAKGRLFTFYAKELVDYIVKKGKMSVSVEADILEEHPDENDPSIQVFTDWKILGVTCLGEGVSPAVPGANIKALAELESEFKALCLKAASYRLQSESEPEDPDDDGIEGKEDEENDDDINEPDDPDGEPDSTEPQKPQNEKSSKGVNNMQVFSKRQVAEIAPKFDGYTVMAAGQDESGIHFCLMSAKGSTALYTMSSLDDVIDPRKITEFDARVSFAFAEDSSIDVELDSLTDGLSASVIAANSKIETLSSELESAKETITAMETAEKKRRLSAAKAAAQSALEKFNANREEKVDVAILEDINQKIDNGDFSECMNGEDEWCGEEAVADAVLTKCARKVIEFDAARVARNSTHYAWDSTGKHEVGASDDVTALLDRWENKNL